MRRVTLVLILAAGCVGKLPPQGDDDDTQADATVGGDTDGGGMPAVSCEDRAQVPLGVARPVELMPAAQLADVVARMPCVLDPTLAAILESTDTMFYDRTTLIPGYQDSFGDDVVAPTGFRPNTIDPELINLAVPGGHNWILMEQELGAFHFPFGQPGGFGPADGAAVDFWHVPRAGGALLPVVWWFREPTELTHRYEWMFPKGTVFGELLYVRAPDGQLHVFEIRTRTRELDGWRADVYRPFPTAASLADALTAKRAERPEWQAAADLDTLIDHLRDDGTLQAAQLVATHFTSSFATVAGAKDTLPGLSASADIIFELLGNTPFVSARGVAWKQSGALTTFAATASAGFSIVPRGYTGGFLSVDDDSCTRCHRDAGRPFRDYYEDIIAYGELWGMDEVFTWHPFDIPSFVDENGDVVQFNYNNREIRTDLLGAGLIEDYDAATHPPSTWNRVPREWTDFEY